MDNTDVGSDMPHMIQTLLEQQLQKNINIQHGLLHQLYQQFEAFITITSLLELRHPLPPMRGWAASPDFLVQILGEVLDRKPDVIMELGGGVSTLVIAYALQKLGKGKLISVEHDNKYLQKTARQLQIHELQDIVHHIHAPLRTIQLDGLDWDWYDLTTVVFPGSIDILVIDGPPAITKPRSRYPALPVLAEQLSADSVVILDDAAREGEKAIAGEWAQRYPEFSHEFVNCEKGTSIFRRLVNSHE